MARAHDITHIVIDLLTPTQAKLVLHRLAARGSLGRMVRVQKAPVLRRAVKVTQKREEPTPRDRSLARRALRAAMARVRLARLRGCAFSTQSVYFHHEVSVFLRYAMVHYHLTRLEVNQVWKAVRTQVKANREYAGLWTRQPK